VPNTVEVTLEQRIALLSQLGEYLLEAPDADLERAIRQSYLENPWFTEANTRQALKAIATRLLQRAELEAWAARYPIPATDYPAKTIALIMAGNIPLVGFHDWLCVFISGQRAQVKLSDKDKRLLPALVQKMGEWQFESLAYTEFLLENDRLHEFDAVIATGSNNTARYFEQYFGKYPHIIRRNRNSIAVLDGAETPAELFALGEDIFSYFGLGCRNVSKIYVPRGYAFEPLLEILHEWKELALHNKYKNNFDYNFTLYILNNTPHLNNGCLLLLENETLSSRIASLHYEYYDDAADLRHKIAQHQADIQCLVGRVSLPDLPALPFGHTQKPGLTDYPDGVDVMAFLNPGLPAGNLI
jgi:hypothetical protein